MNTFKKASAFLLLACALIFSGEAFALSTYTQSVSSVTSVTISNSSHGLGSPNLGVHVYNSSGVRVADGSFTKSINSGTYAVTVTWPSAFTGTVKLTGAFVNGDITNADKDFKVIPEGTGNDKVKICDQCTPTNFALVNTASSQKYFAAGSVSYTAGSGASNARVWLSPDGKVVFGVPFGGALGSCSGGPCEVVADPDNNFPSGVEPIAELYFYEARNYQPIITDQRSWRP
jgi:hypothetical protein